MRTRLLLSTLLAGSLALMATGADAATRTMDGKKVKKLTITANGGAQDNDAWNVYDVVATADEGMADTLPDQVRRKGLDCKPPVCARLEFVYKPAKGAKGGLMFTAGWTNPASDIDLYAVEIAKDGTPSDLGHCAQAGTASEKVYLAPQDLKAGRKYALVIQFFRSLNETVTGTVEMGVPSSIKKTIALPSLGDPLNLNCAL
ncbi:MAG TPA: hypothetical protein VMZ11_03545 [Mycobacteriales bacterium]|nr:hypothetical protein [Mycobacteriales bacterium]